MKTAGLMASLVGLGVCGGVAVGVPVDPEHRHARGEGVGFLEFGVERAGAVERHAGFLSG